MFRGCSHRQSVESLGPRGTQRQDDDIGTRRTEQLGARLVRVAGAAPEAVSFAAVEPDGAAASAGVIEGDVVVTVDGASAQGDYVGAAISYLYTRPAGERVRLLVRRGANDEPIELGLALGE